MLSPRGYRPPFLQRLKSSLQRGLLCNHFMRLMSTFFFDATKTLQQTDNSHLKPTSYLIYARSSTCMIIIRGFSLGFVDACFSVLSLPLRNPPVIVPNNPNNNNISYSASLLDRKRPSSQTTRPDKRGLMLTSWELGNRTAGLTSLQLEADDEKSRLFGCLIGQPWRKRNQRHEIC